MADVLSEGVLKKRKERPKVESEWPDDDIYKLIALVEDSRVYKQSTYKLSRDILWQEIAEALEEKYTVSDCKGKWANLRVIFNTNMHKLRKGGEKKDIKWRFFLPMLFLEAADVIQSKSMETNTIHALAKPKTESDSQWNDEDTYTLIKAVEERPPLWDKLCAEYNRPKDFVWQEVAELLDERYNLSECRDRWLGLRVTFKTIQAKSRIGAHENKQIDWPFYWDMNFLEPPEYEGSQSSFTKEMQRIANLTKIGVKKRGSIGRPTVQYEWSDEDIQNLIEFVKPRQLLWKKDLPKNTKQREFLWQEVVDEFKQKYPVPECKAKWANLRVTFNYNLPRYRNLQAGHSPSETNRISWRFFYSMLFLDNTEKPRSARSVSSVDQLSENIDSTNAHLDGGDEEIDEYQDFISEVFSIESNAVASEHSSKRNSPSSSPRAEPPASKKRCLERKTVNNCNEASVKWADPLGAKDKHNIFGEYVANELRSLENSPDLLHKLKIFIQQKIIEVSSEHAERSFAKQSNQANDTSEQHTTTTGS